MPDLSGLRIEYVVSSAAIGGAEGIALDSAVRLRERCGARIAFVANGAPFIDRIEAAGFPATRIPLRDNADLPGLVRLALHLRRARPDLVHLHMNRAGLLGGLACRWLGIPSIVTAAGMVHRRYVDRADLVLPCSEGVARHLADQGLSGEKVRLLPNAIDVDRYAAVSFLSAPGSTAGVPGLCRPQDPRAGVLIVARLHPNKGHRDLLRAFALLAPGSPGHDLAIAGDGPPAFVAELRALAGTLGIAGRVRFLGLRDDVPALLAGAAAFALPSAAEGLPLTLLEAMAAGLPAVAYAIPGVDGIAPVAEGGPCLVPVGDIPRLAGRLATLLGSPALRARLAERGRATVRARYGLDGYADRLAQIYLDFTRAGER